ncbi:phytanoyl-CoA dioxygenase family protein [Sorangium sp. So ce134]
MLGCPAPGADGDAADAPVRALRAALDEDGHVTVDALLPPAAVGRLRSRLDRVLARKYETGVFPDEAYYRPGATLPNVPRHVVNAWKCDRQIASIATSAHLASIAAEIFGWDSLRLAVDTVWVKPPGSLPIDFHREFEYFRSLDPPDVASCWIALDPVDPTNGALEFASGSHRWADPEPHLLQRLFAEHQGRDAVTAVGDALGERTLLRTVACEAGGCTFFHGRVWHGSGSNTSPNSRWAYGIHWIRGDAELGDAPATYLFGRYKLAGSKALHESFFPLVWSAGGRRSAWVDAFLAGGPLGG